MPRPEMMAIGDSLYNGVRSLTINGELARWSVPRQVADALGIPFQVPDYPRNVVVDMERWLRMFPDIPAIERDVAENIGAWLARPISPSGADRFDNIAIASTTYGDMLHRTCRTAEQELAALQASLGGGITRLGAHLGDLFFAFNTRFVLNPGNDDTLQAASAIDIVKQRLPRRLLVSIGSNDGLWTMAFDAADTDFGGGAVSSMKDFVAALRALPPAVEHIYLNALALPSTVSNLMPLPDYAEYYKPPAGQYYVEYENRFGFSYGRLTGAAVAELDRRVAAFNDLVEHEAAADARIHVVRLDELLKDYDSKHRAEALSVVTADGKTLSNVMTEGAPWPFPKFRSGGLQGLDGMHPTIVGYTLMARKVLEAIKQHEGVTAPLPNLDAAYQADSLLQDVPRQWETVLWAWRDIRRARAFADPAPVGPHEDATKALMQAVQFKTP